MVLPTEITIKQEKEDFEQFSIENVSPADFTDPNYDVTVKIEIAGEEIRCQNGWLENSNVKTEPESFSDDYEHSSSSDNSGVCYEKLIDYCEQKCPICNEKFWESYSLLRHNLKHLKLCLKPIDNQSQCRICLQYFVDRHSVTRHIVLVHSVIVDGRLCYAKDMKELGNEHENFKKTKMLHQCNFCGIILSYKKWHAHMTEVHQDSQFICDICKASFKCRAYIRKHMKKHEKIYSAKKPKKKNISGTTTYPCQQCSSVLKCKDALKTHVRNCHSTKMQCHICKSVLKSKAYLNTHLRRVHYDDGKKHYCECGKSFKSPRYLKIHIKNAHSK